MILDVERANKSANYFEQIIPTLQKYFGGKIITTENHNSEVELTLDFQCGIDGLVLTDDTVFGIAHRVSYKPFHTFTIRTKDVSGRPTEIDHITRPGIKPRYHIQTLVNKDGKITDIAVVKTADLLTTIMLSHGKVIERPNCDAFVTIGWNTLNILGIQVDKLEAYLWN